MGWTINTFSGLKANGPDSNWRVAMFELCRAVNERQGVLFTTKTQFYKGDGTLGTDLAYSDFLGLNIAATDPTNEVYANLQKIRTAISGFVSHGFTVNSALSDLYTIGTLEAAIGGSLSDDPEAATQAEYWQAMRDALNLLIHPVKGRFFGWANARHDIRTGTTEGTQQGAWDEMIADPTVINLPSIGVNGWALNAGGGAPDGWQATTQMSATDTGEYPTLDLTQVKGALTDVWYFINYSKFVSTNYQTAALSIKIGSTTCSKSGFTGTASNESFQGSIGDLSTEAVNEISVDGIIPTSVPFNVGVAFAQANLQGQVTAANIYYDIDGELTDQA